MTEISGRISYNYQITSLVIERLYMGESCIIVYGTTWCGDCHRSNRFLDQHEIPYNFVNIDHDKEGEQYVLKVNKGMRSVPTILFQDGSTLVEPSNAELAQKLNIVTAC